MQQQHGTLPPWDCTVCGTENNWGFKRRCRTCTAYPPQQHRHLQQDHFTGGHSGGKGIGKSNNKGKGKGKGSTVVKAPNSELGTYAYRQMQRANAAQTPAKPNRELQEAKRRAEALSDANKKLQRELAEAKAATSHGQEEEMEWEGPEDLDEEARRARMDKIRGSLPYLEEHFGAESELDLDAQHELEQHQRAIRESKPYKTHRTILERRVEKLQRLQERDHGRLVELNEAAEEIEAKIVSTTNAMAERGKELDTAEAELRELLLKAVGEENTTTTAPDPQQSWDAVVGTVAGLVRQPGVPAQFTHQLEGLFGQLRAMVEQLQNHAAANAAAQQPSYAQVARAAASTSILSASASSPAASTPPTATACAASSTAESAEELRRRQRRARQQQRQTEAIAEFERDYRAKQRAAAADGIGGVDTGAVPTLAGAAQCPDPGPLAAPTPPPPLPAPPSSEPLGPSTPAALVLANGHGVGDEDGGPSDGRGQAPADGSAQHAAATPGLSLASATGTAAPVAAAAAADTEPALESCLSDMDSDITGTLSGEEQQDKMDIEKVVSTIPKEQREGVRAMLEKSKGRRLRQIQRRLKKPIADEPALPRNPKK